LKPKLKPKFNKINTNQTTQRGKRGVKKQHKSQREEGKKKLQQLTSFKQSNKHIFLPVFPLSREAKGRKEVEK